MMETRDVAADRGRIAALIKQALEAMQQADIEGNDRAMLGHAHVLAGLAGSLQASAVEDGLTCRNWLLAVEAMKNEVNR